MENGMFTREEIHSQPEAWSAAVEVLRHQHDSIVDLYKAGKRAQVIFTGCGSTYYLSLAAAALFQELTGFPARAFPASELWLYPNSSYPGSGRVLLVAISRSGETTETLYACKAFNDAGRGDLVILSCYPDKPLAAMGSLNLVLPSGAERSVAQTRAFSTLYLATIALASLWAGREDLFDALEGVIPAGRRVIAYYASLARELGEDMSLDRFYFLGSGPRYGLACELSLKMKEMSLTHSEPFHFLEFRHGPKSMVSSGTLAVGLLSEGNYSHESAVLDDVRGMGGRVLAIGEGGKDVSFDSRLDDAIYNILFLPIGQMLAYERSIAKGLNPDHPNNLDSVVKL